MKTFINKLIAFAVVIVIAAGCTRNGMDSQNDSPPESDKNESAAKDDNDTNAANDDKNVSATSNEHGNVDADFVLAAADGGLLEVRLGELATKQASSEDVKSFGKTMTIDHGKANDELKNLASKLGITVPNGLSEKSQQKFNDLSQKKGSEFDKAYAQMMVDDHQETIEKFRGEANNGQQPEIRDWAGAKVPTLQHHLTMAEKMNDSFKKTPSQ